MAISLSQTKEPGMNFSWKQHSILYSRVFRCSKQPTMGRGCNLTVFAITTLCKITYGHTFKPIHMDTHLHTHVNTYVKSHMGKYLNKRGRSAHSNAHIWTHVNTHILTHVYTHIHIRRAHRHMPACFGKLACVLCVR